MAAQHYSDGLRNRIAEFARAQGLKTAYQLAIACGIRPTTAYTLWQNPGVYPSRQAQSKICAYFQCQPGEFLVWERETGL